MAAAHDLAMLAAVYSRTFGVCALCPHGAHLPGTKAVGSFPTGRYGDVWLCEVHAQERRDAELEREREALRARCCTGKVRYGAATARLVAQRWREQGEHISPYRCPFADDEAGAHWHCGHPVSLDGMERIARVIRGIPPVPSGRQ